MSSRYDGYFKGMSTISGPGRPRKYPSGIKIPRGYVDVGSYSYSTLEKAKGAKKRYESVKGHRAEIHKKRETKKKLKNPYKVYHFDKI